MKKMLLKFRSIADVANCAKTLEGGYIINTVALTLSGLFSQNQIKEIEQKFHSVVIESQDVDAPKSVADPTFL